MRFDLKFGGDGAIVLFISSDLIGFQLVTTKTVSALAKSGYFTQYALCVNNYGLIETDSEHGMVMGSHGCPDWEHAKPAAVVNIEHPVFEGLGFLMLLAGFLLQYLSVPQPKTIAQLRQELKALKLQDRDQL